MELNNGIDIIEQRLADYDISILNILLSDRTTGRNIIWATDDYAYMGAGFDAHNEILANLIVGQNTQLIQPRIAKAQSDQVNRTRNKAEVFTPAWICNAQNNLIDEAWFGQKNVFNTMHGEIWNATTTNIVFPAEKEKSWKAYVDANRLEISCGEAPYLVSRYDAATGKMIPLTERIGLLDRKLRVANENCDDETQWFQWTQRAFQSIYGYEYQGDNLLLARENLLYTFIDNLRFKFDREPSHKELKTIATIISWNLWQMDGMTFTVPYGIVQENSDQLSIFDMLESDVSELEAQQFTNPCRIKDWRSKVILEYQSLVEVNHNA